jgi:hypothetical protein
VEYDKWKFNKYVDPPSLGAQSSKIELQLAINSQTGQVTKAQPLSGDKGLGEFVAGIAEEWVFSPFQDLPDTIKVTVDYSIGCQLTH